MSLKGFRETSSEICISRSNIFAKSPLLWRGWGRLFNLFGRSLSGQALRTRFFCLVKKTRQKRAQTNATILNANSIKIKYQF
jgi:hypothetical protein